MCVISAKAGMHYHLVLKRLVSGFYRSDNMKCLFFLIFW
jgi:hypothetical protein